MPKLTDVLKKTREIEEDDSTLMLESFEVIDDGDKKEIINCVEAAINKIFTLKSYTISYTPEERRVEILVKGGRRLIIIEFNADFVEFASFVVEYLDERGFNWKGGIDTSLNRRFFEIYK